MKALKDAMKNRIRNYIHNKYGSATPNEIWEKEFHFQSSLRKVERLYGEVMGEIIDDILNGMAP